jgi:Fur family ferric uptake transcriptional regulator
MMSCETDFIHSLRERGFRMTPQREMVLGVLHQVEGFVTVEELFQRVRALSAAVDISTVYRTLDLLQEFELVAAIEGSDGQRRYDLLTDHGPHIHLVCSSCGEVIGAAVDTIQASLREIAAQYGFAVDWAQLQLPGRCARCCAAAGATSPAAFP